MEERFSGMSHLEAMQTLHQRRLEALELQQATYGISCPPAITIEIEDLITKIANIQSQVTAPQQLPKRATRRPMLDDHLTKDVAHNVSHQVTHRLRFTAYDITLALRQRLPHVAIYHDDVRGIVHVQMRLIIALGLYKLKVVTYDTGDARQYIPIESHR